MALRGPGKNIPGYDPLTTNDYGKIWSVPRAYLGIGFRV